MEAALGWPPTSHILKRNTTRYLTGLLGHFVNYECKHKNINDLCLECGSDRIQGSWVEGSMAVYRILELGKSISAETCNVLRKSYWNNLNILPCFPTSQNKAKYEKTVFQKTVPRR